MPPKTRNTDQHRVNNIMASFRCVLPPKWVNATAVAWQHVVRIEAADLSGQVTCSACGVVVPYTKSNGGHWIGRGFHQTVFMGDEGGTSNCHPLCIPCNKPNAGIVGLAPIQYTIWMLDRYGRDECERLMELANGPRPSWTMEELAWRKLGYIKRVETAEDRLKAAKERLSR